MQGNYEILGRGVDDMAGLNLCMSTGIQRFTGTEYVNPAHGTRRLCVRTGTGADDVAKYGLTSDMSASKYCGMRMYMDGKYAYIGRSQTYTSSRSSQYDTTSTRQSNYETTSTRSSQYNTTSSRQSNYNTEDWRWSQYDTYTTERRTHGSYVDYNNYSGLYYRSSSYVNNGYQGLHNSASGRNGYCSMGYHTGCGIVNFNSNTFVDYFQENNVSGSITGVASHYTYGTQATSYYGMNSTSSYYTKSQNVVNASYYATRSRYTVDSYTYPESVATTSNRQSWYTTTASRSSQYDITSSRQSNYDITSSRSSQYNITSSRQSNYSTVSHNFNI